MASRRKMVEDGKKRIKEKLYSIKERRDMIEEYVHSIVKQAEVVAAEILVEERSSFLKKYTMAAQRLEELDNLLFQICVALPDPDADDGQRDSTSSDEENTPEKQSHDRDIHKITDCQRGGSKEQSPASTTVPDKDHSSCTQGKSSDEISVSVTDSKDKCHSTDQVQSESPVRDSVPVSIHKEADRYQTNRAETIDKDAKQSTQMCPHTDQLPDKTEKCDSWVQTSQNYAKPADTNSTNTWEKLSPDAETFVPRRKTEPVYSPSSQTESQRAAPCGLVLPVLQFEEQTLLEVIVTHVDSPSLFWLQPRLKDIQTMVEKMQVHYSTRPPEPLFTSLRLGSVVCCQYQVDDDWYRARVIRVFSTSDPRSQEVAVTDKTVVDVLYIDYGNQERTTVSKLQPLHQLFTTYPVYAFPCALAKVGPPDNKADWPAEICVSLGEMLISKGNMYASLSKISHCPLVFTELYLPTPEMSVEKLQKLGPVESILFNIGKLLIQQKSATELPNDTIASAFGLGQIKIGLPDSNLELGKRAFDSSAPGNMQLWLLNDMDVCNAQSPALTSVMNRSCNSPPSYTRSESKDVTPEKDERTKDKVSSPESESEGLQTVKSTDEKHESLMESHPSQEGIRSCHEETLKKQNSSGPQAATIDDEPAGDKAVHSSDSGTQHEDLSSCTVQRTKDESQDTEKSASLSSSKEEKETSASQPSVNITNAQDEYKGEPQPSLNVTNKQSEHKGEPPDSKPECTATEPKINLVPVAANVTQTQASNEVSLGSPQIASVSDQEDGKTALSASSVSLNEEQLEVPVSHDSSDRPRLVSVEETVSDKGDTGYSSDKEDADEKEEESSVCTASLEEKEVDLTESASEKVSQSTTSTDTVAQTDISSTSDELADEYFELMLDREMAQATGSEQAGTNTTTTSVNETAGDRVCESEETASVNSRLSSVSKDTDKRQTQDSVSEASSKSSSQLQEKLRNIGLPDKIPEKCQYKFDSWITDDLDNSTEAGSTAEVPEIKSEAIPDPGTLLAADEQTLPPSAEHHDETDSPNPTEKVNNKPEGTEDSGSLRVVPQVSVTLDDECGFSFLISYVDSPGKFYAHLVSEESQQTIDNLMKNINHHFQGLSRSERQKLSKEYKPSHRDICCAKYKEDEKIYRAEILCIHYDEQDQSKKQKNAKSRKCSQLKVLYIDFGNIDWISPRWVYPLPKQFMDLPKQAICCSLANIEPVIVDVDSDSSDDWGDKATKAFVDMTGFEKKLFGMCVGSKPGKTVSGTYENPLLLLVYDTSGEEDVFINEQLIKQDMAAAVLLRKDADKNKGHQAIKSESREDDILDPEEEEMTMDNWDPMADDYLSLRNSYHINTDDPGVASVGISAAGESQVCQFFASGRRCYRGINCPYLHIRDSGGPSIERRQVFCTNDLEQSLTPPEEGSWVAMEMSAIFNPAHFYAVFPFGTGSIDELINKDSPEDEGYEGSGCCAETLDSMMENLNDHYNSRGSYRDSDMAAFAVGEIIVAKYSHDERWYRAKVIEADPDNFKVHVFYVDFGNSEWVEEMNLRQIQPQFMHLPFQILECFLPLEPLSADGKWTTEAREYFTKLVDGKVLFAQVLSGSHTGIISMDLYDTTGEQEVNINQTLLDKGYARPLQTQSVRVIPSTSSSVVKKKPEPIYMPG